ncbi:MAG: DUF11 domain-containing protein [Planctomycetes bacterium]|nr:DUF11 domain-containing protein [Planctomycetota bacterium]
MTKTVDKATPTKNDTITYTLTIQNNGPLDATTVQITDLLPAGLVFQSALVSQGTYTSTTGVWVVGGITNGQQATLTLKATVDQATANGTVITNTTSALSADQGDTVAGNNVGTIGITITAPVGGGGSAPLPGPAPGTILKKGDKGCSLDSPATAGIPLVSLLLLLCLGALRETERHGRTPTCA